MFIRLIFPVLILVSSCATQPPRDEVGPATGEEAALPLGNFSVSLTVKDLDVSRGFYEKLGFSRVGGEPAQRWLIMQSGTTTIGLFQGMFPRNTLTFNPGWTKDQQALVDFIDVRELQRIMIARGLQPVTRVDPASATGPAYFVLVDPDGNPILFDQHVPSPRERGSVER